jgi:hypothetical protein
MEKTIILGNKRFHIQIVQKNCFVQTSNCFLFFWVGVGGWLEGYPLKEILKKITLLLAAFHFNFDHSYQSFWYVQIKVMCFHGILDYFSFFKDENSTIGLPPGQKV